MERKTRETLAKTEHFAGIMPLAKPATLDVATIMERAQRLVAPSGAKVLLHPEMRKLEGGGGFRLGLGSGQPTETQMLYIVIDHVGLFISAREGQLQHRGNLARWPNPGLWPEGAKVIEGHTAWLEIADLGFMRERGIARLDRAFNRAAAVTAAMAAVAGDADPLAVLWHPAGNALPPATFAPQVARVLQGEAPLDLWLRVFFIRPREEGAHDGVLTRGLASFTGFEIEVRSGPLPREESKAVALEFARMLVDNGTEPRTGLIIGLSGGRTAQMRIGESQTRKGLPVCELVVTESATRRASGGGGQTRPRGRAVATRN
ncbi:MAG: hypothetical protein AAF675_21260 [Pseudomonadota bacterium]